MIDGAVASDVEAATDAAAAAAAAVGTNDVILADGEMTLTLTGIDVDVEVPETTRVNDGIRASGTMVASDDGVVIAVDGDTRVDG